jgi:hypothetical protein
VLSKVFLFDFDYGFDTSNETKGKVENIFHRSKRINAGVRHLSPFFPPTGIASPLRQVTSKSVFLKCPNPVAADVRRLK